MKLASFALDQTETVQFAISADECLLHFDEDELTPKQHADHESNKDLIAFLQVASMAVAKPTDRVALYERFVQPRWRAALDRYLAMFDRLGLAPVDGSHLSFHPRDDFYRPFVETPPSTDLATVFLLSSTNGALRGDPEALAISRDVNSKMTLARDAAAHGLPVPESLVLRRHALDGADARAFIDRHGGDVMLKVMGLSGARNVTRIRSVDEARRYLEQYGNDVDLLLQQRLPMERFTEMTVDLRIADDGIEITNLRQILFHDELWVGNLISHDLRLTPSQEAVLLRVGKYVRSKGYCAAEGLNCGIDFFVGDDDTIYVIEINARWTGGLMPAAMVEAMGGGALGAVAVVDTVRADCFEDYLGFLDAHLFDGAGSDFAMAPLGFSPYPPPMDGPERLYVWQLVYGDLRAFTAARDATLGADALQVTSNIVLPGGRG